jgi:hypothetical protein
MFWRLLPLMIAAETKVLGNFQPAGNNAANAKFITVKSRLIRAGPVGTKVPACGSSRRGDAT